MRIVTLPAVKVKQIHSKPGLVSCSTLRASIIVSICCCT